LSRNLKPTHHIVKYLKENLENKLNGMVRILGKHGDFNRVGFRFCIFISILKFIDIFSAENHVSKIYLNIKKLSIFLVQNHKDLSTVHAIIFFFKDQISLVVRFKL
jgi:hypothetical protein